MNGCHRSGMPRNHRLNQIQRLAATDFSHHDSIWSHSQGINKQIANCHSTSPVDSTGLSFKIVSGTVSAFFSVNGS